MNKTAIKNFAIWARQKLIEDITYKAGLIGVSDKGIAEALPQSTNDLKFYDIGTKNYAEVAGNEIRQREALVSAIKSKERDIKDYNEAFECVIEEVAYTWFNRLIAIRFMEVNDYLPSRLRVLSSENLSKNEPDFVTTPFDTDLEFTPFEQDKVIELKDTNKSDELFRMLFIKQCNRLNDILPELFEKTDDYSELLLAISFTDKDGVVYHLTHDIDEDDFNVSKEGQVEIIGWMYQYYNTEPKDKVFALLKKNVKITKERIPAATQLFTPDWIVRYMVENSLGRLWLEGHENDSLKSKWKYYLDEAKQEPDVEAQLEQIRQEYKNIKPEDIKVIDPCMGSGHILVYAFDVLMQIYTAQGYIERDAAKSIVENNLFGLDIDKRAYQLAYFAVMMKARQYNRRILNGKVKPNLFAIDDSSVLTSNSIDFIANGNGKLKRNLQSIADNLYNAKEYGSIIDVAMVDFAMIYSRIDEIQDSFYEDIFGQGNQRMILEDVLPIIKQAEVMAQKYDVVVTNPPYMGNRGMSEKLNEYAQEHYPDSKSDMFAIFIEKSRFFTKRNGYYGMITQPSFMFLAAFEKLRLHIIQEQEISSLIHMGRGIFGIDFGSTAFVLRNTKMQDYWGSYMKLHQRTFQYIEPGDIEKLYLSARDNHNETFDFSTYKMEYDVENSEDASTYLSKQQKLFFSIQQKMFLQIPSEPIAYWVSSRFITSFSSNTIGDVAKPRQGLATGCNDIFIRQWFEIANEQICFSAESIIEAEKSERKWFPYNKGGEFRKWYGNNDYVVNWENNGFLIRNFKNDKGKLRSRPQNMQYYFRECFSWSLVSSGIASFRYKPKGFIFDIGGMSCFTNDNLKYLLGLCNSPVATAALAVLAPTINYQAGDIANIPVIIDQSRLALIEGKVDDNISCVKKDWDSFETSWDFITHPLVWQSKGVWDVTATGASMNYYYGGHPKVSCPVELCYMLWQGECNERFNTLKANEEELNRFFIDIYGLQDELTPEVEDKDVTVRKADLQRDIKSLISYAVGCMFGRYSLDVDGLAYAGGDWDNSKYSTYIPDDDNCIPVTDEEYFEDDIVGRFVEFIKVVYGKETLEDNLTFIANALGNKGTTSRDVIRNYFLNDFIKDHIKIYQKRPIYWMFDSGKKNGFKALVYMHRWNADTTGNMRVEYLHRMQRVYDKEIERMQEIIDNSHDNKEVNAATKRKEKLQTQLKETKDYDALIAHLALSRIDIDLDDGVKVNYQKVQTSNDGKAMKVLAKI